MLGAAVLKVVLCAAKLQLATVGFTQVGLSDAQASFFAEHFSVQLQRSDESVRVTTPRDMADVLGVERQKALLGCSDTSSTCMAELAGALGADGLVSGQVAKVGKSYQVNVKILASDGSRTLFLHSSKLLPSEEALIEELNAVAAVAMQAVRGSLKPATPGVEASASGPPRPWLRLLPVAAGVVLGAFSGVPLFIASKDYAQLNKPVADLSHENALTYREDGKKSLVAGIAIASVAVVLLVAGLVWFLIG